MQLYSIFRLIQVQGKESTNYLTLRKIRCIINKKTHWKEFLMERYCIYCGKALPKVGNCPCLDQFSRISAEFDEDMDLPDCTPEVPATESVPIDTYDEEPIPAVSRKSAPVREENALEAPPPNPKKQSQKPTTHTATDTRKKAYQGRYVSAPDESIYTGRVVYFLPHYFRDFMGAGRSLANSGDGSCGINLMVLSLVITALSTLFYGWLHLEDFLLRWFFVGVLVPVFTFGLCFVFVGLVIGKKRTTATASSVLSTVGLSAIYPATLQLIAIIPSAMDKSGKVFQFFALLIFLTWLFSLYFTVFSVHRVKVKFPTLMITVIFAFLALVVLRTLWVWFLTGHMQFAFYLPTSLYPGELYEAFLS